MVVAGSGGGTSPCNVLIGDSELALMGAEEPLQLQGCSWPSAGSDMGRDAAAAAAAAAALSSSWGAAAAATGGAQLLPLIQLGGSAPTMGRGPPNSAQGFHANLLRIGSQVCRPCWGCCTELPCPAWQQPLAANPGLRCPCAPAVSPDMRIPQPFDTLPSLWALLPLPCSRCRPARPPPLPRSGTAPSCGAGGRSRSGPTSKLWGCGPCGG